MVASAQVPDASNDAPTGEPGVALTHVGAAARLAGGLGARPIVFTHLPKTAGTTLDHILAALGAARGEGFRRLPGTLYGQALGAAKGEALTAFEALGEAPFARARYLTGHLPFQGASAFAGGQPAHVTLLRDPAQRLLSHFRHGLDRGLWDADASIAGLIARGALCDNAQTRQLAGCRDRARACDAAMLERARRNLERAYAVVGRTAEFDAFLAALIALLGWPDVVYGRYQVARARLPERRRAALAAEARSFDARDRELVAEVERRGRVWINRVDPAPAPARPDEVLVIARELCVGGRNHELIPKRRLAAFGAAMRARGVALESPLTLA